MMMIKTVFLIRQKSMMIFSFWIQVKYSHKQKESFKSLKGKNRKKSINSKSLKNSKINRVYPLLILNLHQDKMVKMTNLLKKLNFKKNKRKKQFKIILLKAQILISILNQIFNKTKIKLLLLKLMLIKKILKRNSILEHKIFLKI
jgi:hypothetical protein